MARQPQSHPRCSGCSLACYQQVPRSLSLRALELLDRSLQLMNVCKEEIVKWNKKLFGLEMQASYILLNKIEVNMSIQTLVFLLHPLLISKDFKSSRMTD